MKTSFPGYYQPSADQYERLWNDGMIVLDTNVLLNLYRLPTTARDELLNVLEVLKERLWIPHQVALEFQRLRLTVISTERKSTENALQSAIDLVAELKRKVDALQIDKRGLGIESKSLFDALDHENAKLIAAIKAVHESQLDISSPDEVRERLDQILANRIGVGPVNQTELDALILGGDERFSEKIPPGFADSDKGSGAKDATFIHNHIKYQKKFGDLILWRQIIQYAKSSGTKSVLLVTADKKDDWWWREQGKTIGAHPELVSEISREGSVNLFWMYSSVQFVEHASKYTAAKVSSQSVAELKQVSHSPPVRKPELVPFASSFSFEHRPVRFAEPNSFGERLESMKSEEAVMDWVTRTNEDVESNPTEFPDFIVRNGSELQGIEVKYLRGVDRLIRSSSVMNAVEQGYFEICEGVYSGFSLVIVISKSESARIVDLYWQREVRREIARILRKYPITAIIVGKVSEGTFVPLIEMRATEFDESVPD